MWTITYSGNKTAIVQDGRYIYEFDSLESARTAVKAATQVYVVYPQGRGNGKTTLERGNRKGICKELAGVTPKGK